MRAKIQDQLEKRSHDEAFEKQAYLIEQALLEKYPLSIPKTYMDAEFKARLTDYLEPLEKKGYSQLIDQDRDKIEKNIMKNATEGLTIYFILQAVAAGAKLEPTNEEISAEYNHENNRDLIMGSYFGGKEAQEELSKKMFEIAKTRKIKKYMIEQVSYN